MDALSAASADFVALFHRQFLDGVVVPVLQLPELPELTSATTAVAEVIHSRLGPHGLAFDALPGLLQRAVLWDAGLVFQGDYNSSGGVAASPLPSLVQVWTQCGTSMAEIVIQPQEIAATQCAITTCSTLSRSSFVSTSSDCDVARLSSASKCAVASSSAPVLANASVWSYESPEDIEARVPTFSLYRHAASESEDTATDESASSTRQMQDERSALFSIRTARSAARSGVAQACPQSLVIPCVPLVETSETRAPQWCHPRSEPELSLWLSDFATSLRAKPPTHYPSSLIYSALTESGINAGPAIDTNDVFNALLTPAAENEDQIAMSADLARHYFRLHAHGGSLSLKLEAHVPAEILARLEPFQISFHDLSGLLQRALLWDTGYALTLDIHGKLQLVAIHVKCGLRMADIALNPAYYLSTGCDWDDCSVRNMTNNATLYSLRSPRTCGIEQLEPVSLCAAGDTSAVVSRDDSSIWALGNLSSASRDTVPGMRVSRRVVNASVLYTIDTSENEVQLGQCPLRPSLTIPCVPFDKVAHQSEWCRPIQSDLVTAWLVFEERQYMALINLIVLSGAVLIAVALDLFIDRKTRRVRDAAVGSASPSIDSADMDITEQSVQQSVVSGWSSTRSSGGE